MKQLTPHNTINQISFPPHIMPQTTCSYSPVHVCTCTYMYHMYHPMGKMERRKTEECTRHSSLAHSLKGTNPLCQLYLQWKALIGRHVCHHILVEGSQTTVRLSNVASEETGNIGHINKEWCSVPTITNWGADCVCSAMLSHSTVIAVVKGTNCMRVQP